LSIGETNCALPDTVPKWSGAHDFIEIKDRDAEGIFLDLLAEGLPIVFQLLVADAAYSVCTLAFDPWESEEEDYCKKDGVYYSLDEPYSESEAITSKGIWIRVWWTN